jgi:type VI secretion system secreted protein Hcp
VAVDYFLKIDGVRGESSDDKHKGEIELVSWSWGISQTGSAVVAGGGGSGKAEFQDVLITMPVSRASPRLMQSCASGKHHKTAVLTVRKAGKSQQEFLVVKLEDVLISGYQTGGSSGSDVILDQVALGFSTVRMEFRSQKPDGSLDAPIQAGWDIKNNKPL